MRVFAEEFGKAAGEVVGKALEAVGEGRPAEIATLLDGPWGVAPEFARLADRTLNVAVGGYEGPHTWQYPARLLTYFAVESDIHQGSTRAYVVHPQPAEHRAKTAPRAARPQSTGRRFVWPSTAASHSPGTARS